MPLGSWRCQKAFSHEKSRSQNKTPKTNEAQGSGFPLGLEAKIAHRASRRLHNNRLTYRSLAPISKQSMDGCCMNLLISRSVCAVRWYEHSPREVMARCCQDGTKPRYRPSSALALKRRRRSREGGAGSRRVLTQGWEGRPLHHPRILPDTSNVHTCRTGENSDQAQGRLTIAKRPIATGARSTWGAQEPQQSVPSGSDDKEGAGHPRAGYECVTIWSCRSALLSATGRPGPPALHGMICMSRAGTGKWRGRDPPVAAWAGTKWQWREALSREGSGMQPYPPSVRTPRGLPFWAWLAKRRGEKQPYPSGRTPRGLPFWGWLAGAKKIRGRKGGRGKEVRGGKGRRGT